MFSLHRIGYTAYRDCVCMCVYVCVCACVNVRACMCICVYVNVRVRVYGCVCNICRCVRRTVYMYVIVPYLSIHNCARAYACTWLLLYVRMHQYTTFIDAYAHIEVSTYIVRMYTKYIVRMCTTYIVRMCTTYIVWRTMYACVEQTNTLTTMYYITMYYITIMYYITCS